MKVPKVDFDKTGGLVPAVIQDVHSGEVRMLGYMNAEALERTARDGWVTFYSRSKGRLWQKGEESGNRLKVVTIHTDCDQDALLIQAEPIGPTCHTGSNSCFGDTGQPGLTALADLYAVIKARQVALPEGSYTGELFNSGLDRIAQKVGEEAVEVVIASKNSADDKFAGEVADLTYHLLVLLVQKGVPLEDVLDVLRRRAK